LDTKRLVITKSGRLDKILAESLSLSRNQIEKLILQDLVSINGRTAGKPASKVQAGDEVSYRFVEAPKREEKSIDFEIDILYEDDDLMVINKPAGLVVHPAPSVKDPTLVDWLVNQGISLSTISGEERHGIVHRIDKDTTGALVIAKNNLTHRKLSEQLQDKSMGRYYLALVDHPLKESREIDAPIARNPKNRLKMAVVNGGRSAKTRFVQLAESDNGPALIAAKLFTGRTHQIRVHLASMGRHILGDGLYGFKSKEGKIPRIYLHAVLLYMVHPASGERLEIEAPLFGDMLDYLKRHFKKEITDEAIKPKYLLHRFDTDVFV